MSPDIEWHIGEEADQETIAKTSPRPPRWRWLAISVVVTLGIGLGVLYRSIPEPPQRTPPPTSIPTTAPATIPLALAQTIEREAQALATGDRATFDELIDINDFEQYRTLADEFRAWGTPPAGSLYAIVDFAMPTDDKAWAEVRQFRDDRYVHEVRFYHLRDGRWWRTGPDATFRSGKEETTETVHFRFTYAVEDSDLILPIATQLEQDYDQICTDFGCPLAATQCIEALDTEWCSPFVREITLTLVLRGNSGRAPDLDMHDQTNITLTFPSPRVMSLYDSSNAYIRNSGAWLLVARIAYGKLEFQRPPRGGEALVEVIFFREYNRLLQRDDDAQPLTPFGQDELSAPDQIPLASIWESPDESNYRQVYAKANAVIKFIDQEFGRESVAKLLKAIGRSNSLPEAIETSQGIQYKDFEQQWLEWLKKQHA